MNYIAKNILNLYFLPFFFQFSFIPFVKSIESLHMTSQRTFASKKCTLFECQGIQHETANCGHYFYASNCRKNEMVIDPLISQQPVLWEQYNFFLMKRISSVRGPRPISIAAAPPMCWVLSFNQHHVNDSSGARRATYRVPY